MTQSPTGVGTAEVARAEARSVGEKAKAEVTEVGGEAKYQAKRLADDARERARQRADEQLARTGTTLKKVSEELRSMAAASSVGDGYLAGFARDGATVLDDMAGRFQDGGLDRALDDVRDFARRRPVVFLAGAFAVGLGLGRLTRAADIQKVAAAVRDDNGQRDAAPGSVSPTETGREFEFSPPQGDPLTYGGSVGEIQGGTGHGGTTP
jgi:hypothetical protein